MWGRAGNNPGGSRAWDTVAFTCHMVPLPCRGLMEKARVASRSAVRSPAPTASLHALRSIFFIARIRSQHHLRHQKYNYCKGGGSPSPSKFHPGFVKQP